MLAISIVGCKKDKIKGCTMTDAKNFNSSAEEDDGSCTYEGQQVLWYGAATSDSLINVDGSSSLTYKVDGIIVGSSATSVYFPSAPSCGQTGSITITKDLGKSKTKICTYEVTDNFGWIDWSGTIIFSANTCTKTELVY